MRSASILLLIAAAGGAVAQAPPRDERSRAVEEAVRRLVAEAEHSYSSTDARGYRRAVLWTRPRSSGLAGVCERDELAIELGPAVAKPGAEATPLVRSVKAQREYRVAADQAGEPRWHLNGDLLESACAERWPGRHGWTSSDGAWPLAAAVRGLAAVKRELEKPRSKIVTFSCAPWEDCADRPRMLSLIDPIEPGPISSIDSSAGCPEKRSCIETSVSDLANCGWWDVRLEFDGGDYDRLRHARLRPSFGAVIACAERNAGF